MPNWSHEVPDDPRGYGLPLIRTPATGTLSGIITSTDLIGCDTHFWGGHTVPCTAPDCEAHEAGIGFRWHAYLAVYNPNTQLHAILELTAQAARKLKDYRKDHHTLRGCRIDAYRWKHKKNGRVILKCEPSTYNLTALPPPPDLTNVMAVIWRLPLDNVFQAGVMRGHPRVHADPNGNGESADPREYETSNP